MSRAQGLLAALMGAQAGGFLAQPPGLDGEPALGIAGISGVPRGRSWDAVASAHAPDLVGDSVSFVVLDDGSVVVDEDLPDGSLIPLADAIEETLRPPYRAAAIRNDADVWSVVAEAVIVIEIPGLEGDVFDLSSVDGGRELTVDDERTIRPLPALDRLVETYEDVALHAERVDDDLFAVEIFLL